MTIALCNLERTVGAVLLERHPRGADLTPAAAVLVEQARDILARVDEATQQTRRVAAGEASRGLTVGLIPATFSVIPRMIIAVFRAQYPPRARTDPRAVVHRAHG